MGSTYSDVILMHALASSKKDEVSELSSESYKLRGL